VQVWDVGCGVCGVGCGVWSVGCDVCSVQVCRVGCGVWGGDVVCENGIWSVQEEEVMCAACVCVGWVVVCGKGMR